VQRRCTILQLPKRLHNKWSSTWGSSKIAILSWVATAFVRMKKRNWSKCSVVSQFKDPKSSKPSLTCFTFVGNSGKVPPDGLNNTHFGANQTEDHEMLNLKGQDSFMLKHHRLCNKQYRFTFHCYTPLYFLSQHLHAVSCVSGSTLKTWRKLYRRVTNIAFYCGVELISESSFC